ncbi:GFA family protein [Solimonas soli]|uniref:GFA family protein n=1 Tax=Solimonas soli TaxID=413479 RepID=UPI0004B77514|nr:GFA family protein [Solimonas soli]
MKLQGSCHCGAVRFAVEAQSPVPYLHCHCSICRKTAGGGGYAINLGADARTLKVRGRRHLRVYHARLREAGRRTRRSPAERHFCGECGSALWLWDPRWPELVHPHASAIDTPLPRPPQIVEAALAYAANWVEIADDARHLRCRTWPAESLADWHRRHGLVGGRRQRTSAARRARLNAPIA